MQNDQEAGGSGGGYLQRGLLKMLHLIRPGLETRVDITRSPKNNVISGLMFLKHSKERKKYF